VRAGILAHAAGIFGGRALGDLVAGRRAVSVRSDLSVALTLGVLMGGGRGS